MKLRKFLLAKAAVLALSLLMNTTSAQAENILGEEVVKHREMNITGSSILSNSVYKSEEKGLQTENYIEYTPNGLVYPIVSYGSKLFGRSTITEVEALTSNKNLNPVAGVNADFFSLETGVPLGMVITDGILRSSDAGSNAVGFDASSRGFISAPALSITMTVGKRQIPIDHMNKWRQPWGIYMLTEDFSESTRNTAKGTDVILGSVQGALKVGGTISAVVEGIKSNSAAIPIPKGKIILTVDEKAPKDKVKQLKSLKKGEKVTITVAAADKRWETVKYAVGGRERLITQGNVAEGLPGDIAPRTAIGLKADGNIILYTVDGRQPGYSSGISLPVLAERLKELGCVEALNLDGGGSTAISAAYPGYEKSVVVNIPSDGTLRKCANYIYLVNGAPKSRGGGKLFLYPFDVDILSGARVKFDVKAADAEYHAINLPGSVEYGIEKNTGSQTEVQLGVVGSDGSFIAKGEGKGKVIAKSGTMTGAASIQVVQNPTDIIINKDKGKEPVTDIWMGPEQQIDLNATAMKGNLSLLAQDNCFQWKVEAGKIGSINEDGVYRASAHAGAVGRITVSAGDVVKVINVAVGKAPVFIGGFEGTETGLLPGTPENCNIELEKSADKVRFGSQSAKISYGFEGTAANEAVRIESAYQVPENASHMNMFIYGDGSGNELYADFADDAGTKNKVEITKLDFTGWKNLSFAVPVSKTAKLSFIIEGKKQEKQQGEIWLDQMLAAFNGAFADGVPPAITFGEVNTEKNQLMGAVTDDSGIPVRMSDVTVTADHTVIPFEYNEISGQVIADISSVSDGKVHRICVTGVDAQGNIARVFTDIPPKAKDSFAFEDVKGHWGQDYLSFLYEKKIIRGSGSEGGKKVFEPERYMTRAEYAVMVCNVLGMDKSMYENTALPFSDLKSIPQWALKEIKALYGAGLISGKVQGNGQASFEPDATITRAEAFAVIGRTLKNGNAEPDLSFIDTGKIPQWALRPVKKLVGLHMISGYDDQSIHPEGNIKRAEAAKLLYNIY